MPQPVFNLGKGNLKLVKASVVFFPVTGFPSKNLGVLVVGDFHGLFINVNDIMCK